MSASLVGSEMCIRDRSGRVRGPPLPPSAHSTMLPEAPPPAPEWAPTEMKACLLYTSDAADDM
eukprot:8061506-Alexandrium_andersonii.AAC.1